MSDLPGPLRLTSSFPFVGRSAELGRLRALLAEAGDEGTRVALLGGEPGSGKSRLVREFAAASAADGALVLYGACDVQVRSPYGAFVEALDQLARAAGPEALRAAAGAGAGVLAISADLDELLALCHRIVVLLRGRLVGELAADELRADDARGRLGVMMTAASESESAA